MASESVPGPRTADVPWGPPSRAEGLALLTVLALAALTRLPGLAARGQWDSDQGGQMLTLRAFVQEGVVPLVGPPASVGGFHHGALYYWLLAPAAAVSGGNDPVPVLCMFALAGITAVAAAWWVARGMGGPLAGIIAALLLAVSAPAIAGSVWLWNPNLVPLPSLVAVGAAWRGWQGRHPGWWVVSAAALTIAGQLHVLAWLLALPVGALFATTLLRSATWPGERRRVLQWGLAGIGVIALSYLPLLAYEMAHDFAETRGVLAFLAAGGSPASAGPLTRLFVVTIRLLAWPLAGLLTTAPVPAVLAAVGVGAGLVWRAVVAPRQERAAARWLLASLVGACLVLGLGVGALAEVTPLTVDQYHAAFDPLVVVSAALAIAGLAQADGGAASKTSPKLMTRPRFRLHPTNARLTGGSVAAVLVSLCVVGWNIARWPPAVSPDGGWPAAEAAARRLEATVGHSPFALVSLPSFKPADAYRYPLVRDGFRPVTASGVRQVVVLCDDLFVTDCPAASGAEARTLLGAVTQTLAFSPAPGRHLTVYVRRN